jgi:hypothetical protein
MCQGALIEHDDLPVDVAPTRSLRGGGALIPGASMADIEKHAILATLELTGGSNPLDGASVGENRASAALGDLDGDGDLDLVAGEEYGTFKYFQNLGTATIPLFVQATGAANPLEGFDVGLASTATLGDLDGDGDLDLIAGRFGNALRYYKNTGTAITPAFLEQTGGDNPLDGQIFDYLSKPEFGDLDGDGDLDLVVGHSDGLFDYYKNTGSVTGAAFAKQVNAANPLDGLDVGGSSAPVLGDVDHDGDLDLVAGESGGTFLYYENTGSATSPAFIPVTGSANPFDGEDAGSLALPDLGDINADGHFELVAGENSGQFRTYTLPEPGSNWLLAAGFALLKGLDRRRRRRGSRSRRSRSSDR